MSARHVLPHMTAIGLMILQGVSGFNHQQAINQLNALSTESIIGIAVAGAILLIGIIAFLLVWYFAEKLGITCLTGNGPKRRTAPAPGPQKTQVTVISTTTTAGQHPHSAPAPVYPAPVTTVVHPAGPPPPYYQGGGYADPNVPNV